MCFGGSQSSNNKTSLSSLQTGQALYLGSDDIAFFLNHKTDFNEI